MQSNIKYSLRYLLMMDPEKCKGLISWIVRFFHQSAMLEEVPDPAGAGVGAGAGTVAFLAEGANRLKTSTASAAPHSSAKSDAVLPSLLTALGSTLASESRYSSTPACPNRAANMSCCFYMSNWVTMDQRKGWVRVRASFLHILDPLYINYYFLQA